MATYRPLSRAPVLEAVLQFRFATSVGRTELDKVASVYLQRGWTSDEVKVFEAQLQLDGAPQVTQASAAFQGLVLREQGNMRFVQLRADSLSVSEAQGYAGWDALLTRAGEALTLLVAAAGPRPLVQISTRFINKIGPFEDLSAFEDVLVRPPLPVDELGRADVSAFLRRHVLENLEGGCKATLTIGTVPYGPDDPPVGRPLILDSDVVLEGAFAPDLRSIVPHLALLRTIKNRLFFGSLTEDVVEKFV